MYVNGTSAALFGGYYDNTAKVKDEYKNTDIKTTEYFLDTALTETSANGDFLELSAESLQKLESFVLVAPTSETLPDIPEPEPEPPYVSPYDYDAILAQLKADAEAVKYDLSEKIYSDFLDHLKKIEEAQEELADTEGVVANWEAEIAAVLKAVEDHEKAMEEIENQIAEKEAFLDELDILVTEKEDAITAEEDRLENIVDILEDIFEKQIEKLENKLDKMIDKYDIRLEKKLARLDKKVTRFNTKMDKRWAKEEARRLAMDEKLAELALTDPAAYAAALVKEMARREKFDLNTDKLNAKHEKSMIKAQNSFDKWNAKALAGIATMETNIANRIAGNEVQLEAHTTSKTLGVLNEELLSIETVYLEAEAVIEQLGLDYDALEQDEVWTTWEKQIEDLEVTIENYKNYLQAQYNNRLGVVLKNIDGFIEYWQKEGYITAV